MDEEITLAQLARETGRDHVRLRQACLSSALAGEIEKGVWRTTRRAFCEYVRANKKKDLIMQTVKQEFKVKYMLDDTL